MVTFNLVIMSLRNNIFVTVSLMVVFIIFVISSSVVLEIFVSRVTGPDIVKKTEVSAKSVETPKNKKLEFKKYTNAVQGFELYYPDSWEVMSENNDFLTSGVFSLNIVERSATSSKKAFNELTPSDNLVLTKVLLVSYFKSADSKNLSPEEYLKSQGLFDQNTKINPGINGFPTYFSILKNTQFQSSTVAIYTIFKGTDLVNITFEDRTNAKDEEVVEMLATIGSRFKFLAK